MSSKWTSRKWWAMLIGSVYTMTATLGFDVPVEEVLITDALVSVWILAEAIVDAMRK